jgi:hypothetical protein
VIFRGSLALISWDDHDFAMAVRFELTVRVDDPIQREAARDDRGQPSLRGKRQRLRDERANLLMTDKARRRAQPASGFGLSVSTVDYAP